MVLKFDIFTMKKKVKGLEVFQLLHTYFLFLFPVTHVVAEVNKDGMCPRTLKYLHAVMTGKWIVGFNCEWKVY